MPVRLRSCGALGGHQGQRAVAVPLELEGPGGIVEGRVGQSGEHRAQIAEPGRRIGRPGRPLPGAEDQPLVLAAPPAGAHQVVVAAQDPALEDHLPLVVGAQFLGPGAAVPHRHPPGAVLALRDHPGEGQVLERVVLRAHREPLDALAKGQALRDGPRRQRPVDLEPQVEVERTGVVALHHEAVAARGRDGPGRRLGRGAEVAPLPVLAKRGLRFGGHVCQYPSPCPRPPPRGPWPASPPN